MAGAALSDVLDSCGKGRGRRSGEEEGLMKGLGLVYLFEGVNRRDGISTCGTTF